MVLGKKWSTIPLVGDIDTCPEFNGYPAGVCGDVSLKTTNVKKLEEKSGDHRRH